MGNANKDKFGKPKNYPHFTNNFFLFITQHINLKKKLILTTNKS